MYAVRNIQSLGSIHFDKRIFNENFFISIHWLKFSMFPKSIIISNHWFVEMFKMCQRLYIKTFKHWTLWKHTHHSPSHHSCDTLIERQTSSFRTKHFETRSKSMNLSKNDKSKWKTYNFQVNFAKISFQWELNNIFHQRNFLSSYAFIKEWKRIS